MEQITDALGLPVLLRRTSQLCVEGFAGPASRDKLALLRGMSLSCSRDQPALLRVISQPCFKGSAGPKFEG